MDAVRTLIFFDTAVTPGQLIGGKASEGMDVVVGV